MPTFVFINFGKLECISYITGGVGNRRMVHTEVCTMYTVQAFTGVQKYIGTI